MQVWRNISVAVVPSRILFHYRRLARDEEVMQETLERRRAIERRLEALQLEAAVRARAEKLPE